jgi:ATP-binding cassette subfamily F protein uup
MERFLFDADAQWAPIGTLSGGERRRLQLLLVLAGLPNVLLLDEPTNDLDLDTLRALEDYLEGWPGSLVVVSHDRALLERTVEDVLVLDGVGGARLAPGGYAEYEADRRRLRDSGRREGGSGKTPSTHRPSQVTATRPTALPAAPSAAKPRSASTLRRLVTIAERDMATASERRARLEAGLAEAAGDHAALAAAAHALAGAEVALAEAEDRWLSLTEELGA